MQNVTVELEMSELVYDIQNKTYLTGRSRREGNNHEAVANMQANDDEENLNQVLRSISTAWGTLRNSLSEYLETSSVKAGNKLIDSGGSLVLSLRMPSNYNLSALGPLGAAAHQFVVSTAVCEWFTITHKKDAPEYAALAKSSLELIEETVNKRQRPRRAAAGGS